MSDRIDRFTGKPIPAWKSIGRPAGYKCSECDADVICDCPMCGAPNCCPRCCFEDSEALASTPNTTPYPSKVGSGEGESL